MKTPLNLDNYTIRNGEYQTFVPIEKIILGTLNKKLEMKKWKIF
jgi:hypothetical protein